MSGNNDVNSFYEMFTLSLSSEIDGDVAYMFYLNEFNKYSPSLLKKMLREWKKNPNASHDAAMDLMKIYRSLHSRREKLIHMTVEQFRQYKMLQLSRGNASLLEMIKSEILDEYNHINSDNKMLEESFHSESGNAK